MSQTGRDDAARHDGGRGTRSTSIDRAAQRVLAAGRVLLGLGLLFVVAVTVRGPHARPTAAHTVLGVAIGGLTRPPRRALDPTSVSHATSTLPTPRRPVATLARPSPLTCTDEDASAVLLRDNPGVGRSDD